MQTYAEDKNLMNFTIDLGEFCIFIKKEEFSRRTVSPI